MSTIPNFNLEIKIVFDFNLESAPIFSRYFPFNSFDLKSINGIEYTGKFENPCINKFNKKESLLPTEIPNNHKILAGRFILQGKLRVHEDDLDIMKKSIPLRELSSGKRKVSSIPSVNYHNVGNRAKAAIKLFHLK